MSGSGRYRGAALIPVACASLLAGCATYHAKPLPPAADLARAPPLTVPARRFGVRRLKPATFDPTRGLTETNIITLAVADDPALEAERLRAGMARAQLLEAGLLPDPRLSGGMSWSAVRTGYDAALGQDIQALLTRGPRRAAAAAHVRQVNLEILWQEWQVAERARELYIQLQALDALRPLLNQHLDLLGRLYRENEAALARGERTAEEAMPDFAAWRAAQADWRSFALEENHARHALDELLGLAPGVRLHLRRGGGAQGPLSRAAYRAAVAALPHRRPDLLALEAGYHSEEERLREAVLAQFPLISADVAKARSAEEGIQTIGFDVTVTLPLFNRNRGPIAIARATRAYLRQAYQARLDESESQADELYRAAAIMQHQLGTLQARLPDLERTAAVARESLERGDLGLAGYSRVQSNLFAARAELIRLRASLEQAQAALATLLAVPFEGAHQVAPE